MPIDMQNINVNSMTLDMIEESRISYDNRIRQFTRTIDDSDGINRGFGLNLFHPAVEIATLAVEDLKVREKANIKQLEKAMKETVFADWVDSHKGVGLKSTARLLAAIGDPAYNQAEQRSRRNVSELWAYCGMHPGAKRVKGQKSNWNMTAGKRLHVIADGIIKQGKGDKYRILYDTTKAQYRANFPDKVHVSGNKYNYTDAHIHNMALRRMKKEILKDLFNIAKENADQV